MKKALKKVLIFLLLIPFFTFSQTTAELDFIAPFSDGVAAVKKANLWGFINDKGVIVINFRNDLVLTKFDDGNYPIFKNNRCIISSQKEGVIYFGYIDKTGETLIAPKFLNASNFKDNEAIVLELIKNQLGENEILGKNIVYYRYFEVTIDIDGNIKNYLNPKGVNVVLDKVSLLTQPKITSKRISNNIYAVLNENRKWTIVTINK